MQKIQKGFTLVELLIVLAVIAVLAAVCLPVLSQSRAPLASCLYNEKQIGASIALYNQDYDNRWIDRCAGYNLNSDYNNISGGGYCVDHNLPSWIKQKTNPQPADNYYLLQPYLRDTEVIYCPNIHKGGDANGNASFIPNYAANELWSDGSNSPAYPGSGGFYPQYLPPDLTSKVRYSGKWRFTGAFGRMNAQLAHPATLILLWEHNNPSEECNTWSTQPGHWYSGHNGGFNVTFADGHVKPWTLSKMTNRLVCYWDLP